MALVGYEWILIIVGVFLIIGIIWRLTHRRSLAPTVIVAPAVQPSPTIIKEREVIREVVMVHCRYCGGLMPQASTFCPNCGGRAQ